MYARGEGKISGYIDDIIALLTNIELKKKYDPLFVAGHLIEELSNNILINYLKFKKFGVDARDYVTVCKYFEQKNVHYVVSTSTIHS